MKLRLLTAALWILPVLPAIADHDAVADLGCRPNDPTFDNGAVISAATRDGRVNDTLHFPGGIYYHSTTIDSSDKDGLCFRGQGIAQWLVAGQHGSPARRGASPAIFVYTGPADQPAWRLRGFGTRLEGINIWRGFKAKPDWDGSAGRSVGLEITRTVPGSPSGKHSIGPVSLAGWDKAISFVAPNHADSTVFSYIHAEHNRTVVACTNA